MHSRSFMPSPRAINWLVAIGFASLGYALYVRYLLIESSVTGLACEAGLAAVRCTIREVAIFLFRNQVFGIVAIVAAVYQLLRPNVYAFALALAAASFGLVLYNNGLAAIAVAFLVVSFARPAIANMSPPAPEEERQTTGPASSAASR